MIAEAERAAAELGLSDSCHWIRARAEQLRDDLGEFDVVAFGQSFRWMDRPRRRTVQASFHSAASALPVMWRKATASSPNDDCVECGTLEDTIVVRDSKEPHGPALTFSSDAWLAFVAASVSKASSPAAETASAAPPIRCGAAVFTITVRISNGALIAESMQGSALESPDFGM
ncbi:DUF397 domain-containing protein [Kitasatospora sp. NPDC057541]|uniref:DUF397 domain-containing protein n=1 Tax=unclassified Kitasatospora TaxID=2633591 RepID=UPI0036752966